MDPIVYVKLYDPNDDDTILLTEYNPETGMGYGWMEPIFEGDGLAHIDVRELENTGIECDPTWQPKRLSEAVRDWSSRPSPQVDEPHIVQQPGRGIG